MRHNKLIKVAVSHETCAKHKLVSYKDIFV